MDLAEFLLLGSLLSATHRVRLLLIGDSHGNSPMFLAFVHKRLVKRPYGEHRVMG